MNLTIVLVKKDGLIDEAASIALFTAELQKTKVAQEMESGQIADAVNAVFDKFKGVSINLPALCTYTMGHLGATPATYNDLVEKVSNYVRDNSDRPAQKDPKDKEKILVPAEAPRTRLFSMNKGKGGGVKRWSDVPVESTSESK